MSRPERLALVDHEDPVLSIVAQCRLLKVPRSTLYYRPVPVSAGDLAVMRRMDELYLASPFYGSRRMAAVLRREGWLVNRKRAKRLMRVMGLEAIYQKPNTSRGHPDHKVYPYLLRGLIMDRPSQVCCADITYIPMGQRFCVSGRGHGLVQPSGPGVAGLDHHGGGLLCRGAARSDEPARPA
jgi:putative transposase